jgi:uncharacterized membrane protein (UPF0127 family)
MRVVTVTDTTRGTTIGDRIQVADTSLSRMFGLLGKRGLNPGEGLWIMPSSGVHTVGMMFSIDVIGLDKQLRVIKLWPRLVPFRVTSVSLRMRSVIELEAGRIDACQVALGDVIQIS